MAHGKEVMVQKIKVFDRLFIYFYEDKIIVLQI